MRWLPAPGGAQSMPRLPVNKAVGLRQRRVAELIESAFSFRRKGSDGEVSEGSNTGVASLVQIGRIKCVPTKQDLAA